MNIELFQVDAFTDRPFSGNPAAVCLLPDAKEAQWMQRVAAEMNLSETAFLYPKGERFDLRWFTPCVEVDLCGHATLASAHILWETGLLAVDQAAQFDTKSGLLSASKKGDWIELDFPSENEKAMASDPNLIRSLGLTPRYVGRNRFDILVEVESEEILRAIQPDFKLLESVPTRGVIVTSRASSPEFDFVSRFFAPRSGIDEDPVTGSAYCCLGPFWQERLGKDQFIAYQASARGGTVHIRLSGSRVTIGGQAVTVSSGSLLV